jgi:hypothetical protein
LHCLQLQYSTRQIAVTPFHHDLKNRADVKPCVHLSAHHPPPTIPDLTSAPCIPHRASKVHALRSTWSSLSSPADCAIYPRLPRSVHDPDPRRYPTSAAVARLHKRAQAEEWGCAKFNLHLNNGRTQGVQSCGLGVITGLQQCDSCGWKRKRGMSRPHLRGLRLQSRLGR